jgi:hypothetical protein
MEDLRHVMRIIDENSVKLPEGDYLEICNRLQNIFRNREVKEMTPIVDYEHFEIYMEGVTDTALDYFYDRYYSESLDRDIEFLMYQKRYLESEINCMKPLKRITKFTKYHAIRHYCQMHEIVLEQYSPEFLKKHHDEYGFDIGCPGESFNTGLQKLYRSYLMIENHYRNLYRVALEKKIEKIVGWIDNFDDM